MDVEDYYHVSAFEGAVARSAWGGFECRVASNTQRLLDLLARRSVHATFFVLGWIAKRRPELIRAIHDAGHEIGSHSFWHRLVYRLTPEEFREDLRRSRDAIEDATGVRVRMYRAPSFSITRRSLWAFDVLAEEGIEIDSSVFPVRHDRYGIPDARPEIHTVKTESGNVVEFPPTVVEFGALRLPVAGGGYLRLYPLSVTNRALQWVERRGRPAMLYVHPWEIDPDQPRLSAGSRVSRFRHYVNLRSTAKKLDRLLQNHAFNAVGAVAATHQDALQHGIAAHA